MADESNSCSLAVRGITKQYGDFLAVDDLSLAVPGGTIFGLLGPNGAGKTTTIRMIMDIIAPDHGEVRFFGRPRKTDDLKRIGYLPEERGLYRKMKVTEHLVFLGELHGLSKRDAVPRIEEWLERVELGEWADKKVEELSKGMQQKIQFVASVIHQPSLVILDEPFSGLDPVNMRLLRDLVLAEHRRGATIIFSTHVMPQAEQICDHVVMIHDGNKVLDESLEAIRAHFDPRTILFEPMHAGDDGATLGGLSGIDDVHHRDGAWEISLVEGADPADAMRRIVDTIPPARIELRRPTLEDIFVDIVGHTGAASADETERLRASLRDDAAGATA